MAPLAPVRFAETVETFHHRPITAAPEIWIPNFGDETALVLGSRQDPSIVDRAAATAHGVTITTRRSGGGAVLVSADDLIWFDVIVPANDQRFDTDVRRSFDWLGERLVAALDRVGVSGGTAHRGGLVETEWSDQVCFAGLGPGEVSVDGRKIVGISQRRTRQAARFQVAILRRWEPERTVELLALTPEDRRRATSDLADVAVGIETFEIDASPGDVVDVAIEAVHS